MGLVMVCWLGYLVVRSPYEMMQNIPREQPVPFSHENHVGGLGIGCRYCYLTVEYSSFANIPATKICMNCHSLMWATSPMLEPVRESYRTGKSIEWTRVHDLPEFVYFNHSIHVHEGIRCSTCHGRIDKMPLTWQAAPLTMEWCLDFHRHQERMFGRAIRSFRWTMLHRPTRSHWVSVWFASITFKVSPVVPTVIDEDAPEQAHPHRSADRAAAVLTQPGRVRGYGRERATRRNRRARN